MTRTHIIAADGTRFHAEGRNARLTRRILAGFALITTALFLSAAIIGLQRAAISHPAPLPKPLPAAITACAGAPKGFEGDCIALYLRPAYTQGNTHTPAGPALVDECMRDEAMTAREIGYCLTQPIG